MNLLPGSNIHFIGIGGVGMAALAFLLKGEGYEVDGCDVGLGPRVKWLEKEGIKVAKGHAREHIENASLVIATPAVAQDNPELIAAKNSGRLAWRGEVLADIVSKRDSIAVCGSHGKTTTSTFIAKLLKALGEDVAWAIGGETGDFPVAGTGKGPLVVEADESDGTLALYKPSILVVTNCEYDHPDFFKTPAEYFACYDKARSGAKIVIESEKLVMGDWEIPVKEEHNRKNARAAIEVALSRGYKKEEIEKVLAQVVAKLPDRRFERIAEQVYTDYAHHPTEMKCAISMARAITRGTLRVLFQPHRYSRTKALLETFPAAFEGVDELILCPTYAAFEKRIEGGDIANLYAGVRKSGVVKKLYLARSIQEAWNHAKLEMREGDTALLLGAGDIIKLRDEIASSAAAPYSGAGLSSAKELAEYSFFRVGGKTFGGGKKRIVGAGSNLWISDLTTNEEYVRSSGAAARSGAELHIPWMAGIPGTIGGWLKMNAGAFGHSISEVVKRVKVDGKWLEKDECGFGYRHSSIEGEIEDVEFLPCVQDRESEKEYLQRRKIFPPRCCGSVFKNPPDDFAGRLLEEAGAKNLRVGGAYVWENHANVIVAGKNSTSSDILALALVMQEKVFFRFGILLEFEISGLVSIC